MDEKNLLPKTQINPATFDQRFDIATKLAKSNLTGELNTPEKVFLALQTGAELGISPMAAIRGIHVIKGKPTLSADLMMGLIMARDDFAGLSQAYGDNGDSHITIIKRKFKFGVQEFKGEFSILDAENAGLIKPDGSWEKYKSQMLQHRSDTIAARKAFPDIFTGVYTPEEIDPEYKERPVQAEVIPEVKNTTPPAQENKKQETKKTEKQPVKIGAEDLKISLDKLQRVCDVIALNDKAYKSYEEKAKFMPLDEYEALLTKSIIEYIGIMIEKKVYNDSDAIAEILKIEDYKTMSFIDAIAALESLENTFNPKQGAVK